jgi:hypothetical protein
MDLVTYAYCVTGLVATQFVVSCGFAILLYRLMREIDRNYSLPVRLRYKFLIGSGWLGAVRESDILLIRKYRSVLIMFYVFSVTMIALHYPLWLWFAAEK